MSTQMSEEKRKSLEAAMGQIEKAFGKGSIMKLSGEVQKMPSISTGSIKIDHALGIGGLPKGRIIEIYGPESSGKTTLTLQVAAECQKAGGVVAFVDAEHALDPSYAQKLGVNVEELLVSQPDTGEQALEIVDMLTRSGAVDLIIVDSVAALVPKAEIEGEMGDSHMGLQARLMSQALRKITGKVKDTNTTIIFINQLRMKIGVVFGNPETTTGGNALKFYASVRIDIRGTTPVKEGDVQVGKTVKVKIIKNKVSPPFKEAEVNLLFGSGIDKYGEVIDFAVEQGLLTKSGAWYGKTGVGNLAQGKANMRTWLIEHPEESDAIEHQVRVTLGLLEDVKPVTKKNEKLDKADK